AFAARQSSRRPAGPRHDGAPIAPPALCERVASIDAGRHRGNGDAVHIVVVGCGRVGSELAGLLEKSGHTVAVIDKRPTAFRRLPTGFGGAQIVGFGFDRDTLTEAGIERAGALAAVTSGDNSN